MIKLELLDQKNQVISGKIDHEQSPGPFSVGAEDFCILGIKEYRYQPGDKIRITVDLTPAYYMVQLDETLAPSLIYLTQKEWIYAIPLAESLRKSSVETAFGSARHHLMVRKAYDFEVNNEQNLSFNAHDQKEASGAFPHATANVETRDESVFFAKNAIDGKYANRSHGSYPFASWGINQQADASLTIDFGRAVEVHGLGLLLRHDFPHDSYWTSVEIEFSTGKSLRLSTEKAAELQKFEFAAETITHLTLKNLKKAEDDSHFPALTQIDVFGKNVI